MKAIHTLLDMYDGGRLSRRELAAALGAVALASGARGTAAEGAPAFRGLGIDHVALTATDPERTARFYERMLGATRVDDGPPTGRFLAVGSHAVNLFLGSKAGLDHVCFAIDAYDQQDAARRIKAAGAAPILESNRTFFLDPDGLKVQVGAWGAGGQKV